jgi:light-regulated signal transduction histidine kinase (bacteriophytochrome)
LHAGSDIIIGLAYVLIPLVLFRIVRKRTDLPIDGALICFTVFIAAGSLCHFTAAWNVWHDDYVAEGLAKLVAALTAIPVAILILRAVSGVLDLPSRRELKETNEALSRANRELEAFSASVSHDLRSPLSMIAGQAGLLALSLGSKLTSDDHRRLAKIEGGVKHMAELLDALLALSRISRHTLYRENVDVSALAQEIAAELRHREQDRVVDITVQPGMTAHGDRRLIGDLFSNLIDNAWKFTRNASAARIEVGHTRQGRMALLYVKDNGAGFDMAYAQKLFQPFQRLHSAEQFAGNGVGLATVARIVERHGGRIWSEAETGKGATFYFTLPLAITTEKRVKLQPAPVHSA